MVPAARVQVRPEGVLGLVLHVALIPDAATDEIHPVLRVKVKVVVFALEDDALRGERTSLWANPYGRSKAIGRRRLHKAG